MADFYAARAGTNAGAPLDGFLTAVHTGDAVQNNAPMANGEPLAPLIGRTVPERSAPRDQPDHNSDDAAPKRLR